MARHGKKNSKKLDYHYLDINKELDNYNFFKEDELHLNDLGYTKLNIKINKYFYQEKG